VGSAASSEEAKETVLTSGVVTAKEYVKMLYLSQLMLLGGNVAVIQPGYQAEAIKELLPLLPPVDVLPEGDPEGCGVDKDDGDGVKRQEGAAQMSGSEARSDRE